MWNIPGQVAIKAKLQSPLRPRKLGQLPQGAPSPAESLPPGGWPSEASPGGAFPSCHCDNLPFSSQLHRKLAVLLLGGVLLLAYGPVTAHGDAHDVLKAAVMLVTVRGGRYPLWVIRSTACCNVFTKNRTSRTIGIVRRQGLGLPGPPASGPPACRPAARSSCRGPSSPAPGAAALRQARAARAWRSLRWLAVQSCCCSAVRGQKAQLVGQRRLAQTQTAGSLGLGAAPQPDDLLDAARRVKRVQLAALQIFEKSQRGGFAVVIVGKDSGDLFQLGQPAGTQPALPRHKLIFADADPPHADGLQQPFCKMLTASAAISGSSKAVRA